MSADSVKEVIAKLVSDEEFRNALLEDAEAALKDFDLTEEEREQLSSLDEEMVNAEDLEERISRWGLWSATGI